MKSTILILATAALLSFGGSTIASAKDACTVNWVNGACGTPPLASNDLNSIAAAGTPSKECNPKHDECHSCGPKA